MQRIEITKSVVVGHGAYGEVGDVLEVDDKVAVILIRNKQARIAPAPAAVAPEAPQQPHGAPEPRVVPEPKKGR